MKIYKNIFLLGTTMLMLLILTTGNAKPIQNKYTNPNDSITVINQQITLKGANLLAESARSFAKKLHKEVAIAVVDAGGNILLINRDNSTGPHNADAARLKAFTSLSTKSNTLQLGRNAKSNPDTENLATVKGLLLLGGGEPIFEGDKIIGAIGIAGGGGPENDDSIAKNAVLTIFKNNNLKH